MKLSPFLGREVVLQLADGSGLCGVLVSAGPWTLRLVLHDGAPVVVRRSAVVLVAAEPVEKEVPRG